MVARASSALLVLVVLLGACSGDGSDDEPGATVPLAPTTTSTTEVDVKTIPPTIDEAYVNRVLAALDAVDGEATRIIVQNRKLVPEATALLRAIYDEAEFREQTEVWLRQLQRGLQNFKPEAGSRKTMVRRVVSAGTECIFVEAARDVSAVALTPGPFSRVYIQLVPLDPARDAKGLNPTRWMMRQEGDTSDASDPGDLCAA